MRADDPGAALAALFAADGADDLPARASAIAAATALARRSLPRLDAGAAARAVARATSRRAASRPIAPIARRIRFARCGWSRLTSVQGRRVRPGSVSDGRARPTGWRSRPGAASRASLARSSRSWRATGRASCRPSAGARRLGAPGRAAAQPGADRRGRPAPAATQNCGWQALTVEIVASLCQRAAAARVPALGRAKAQAFFDGALPAGCRAARCCATRHPSYDFERAVHGRSAQPFRRHAADLVDWWALGSRRRPPRPCYSPRFVSEGCPSG